MNDYILSVLTLSAIITISISAPNCELAKERAIRELPKKGLEKARLDWLGKDLYPRKSWYYIKEIGKFK